MQYILVLDQGTTSTRAIIYDDKGNIISKVQETFKQIYPTPGYVEHDPADIIGTARSTISQAINKARIKYSQIKAMGITNQRESIVCWNKETGEPIYNVIVWQCSRTNDYCANLKNQGYEELIKEKTGLKIDSYFSATKIKWILDNVPEAKKLMTENKLCVGTIDTFLMFNLSGGQIYATDYTNASRTMLFNIHTLMWDDDLCKLFNIDKHILPEVHPSGYFYGKTSLDILGLEIPICAVAGDQQSALFGQLCTSEKQLKVTYGTGCFLLVNTGSEIVKSKNGLLSTMACSLDEKPNYALEGSVFIGGALVQWLRDELNFFPDVNLSEDFANKVEDTNGVYIIPAFVGMGAPYWNSNSKGLITGLTRGANKYHITRACLEAIDFQVYDVIDAMKKDFDDQINEIKVDGGACVNNFLMQFQADILNIPISRPLNYEVTSLGVYYLAGLKINIFSSIDEIKKMVSNTTVFKPNISEQKSKELIDGWHKSVNLALTYEWVSV